VTARWLLPCGFLALLLLTYLVRALQVRQGKPYKDVFAVQARKVLLGRMPEKELEGAQASMQG